MNKYLEGIKDADRVVMKEIYQKFFPATKRFILNNNGQEADAKDVFQEALIATYRRLQRADFEITATFGTYIFSVGKNIWFKKLKKKKGTHPIEDFKYAEIMTEVTEEEKYTLFRKGLEQLGKDCQKVLNYYFDRKSFKEIAGLMKYKGEDYARRKKYLCTKKLMKIVKSDSGYSDIYNN